MDPVTLALAKGYTDERAGSWREIRRAVLSSPAAAVEFSDLPPSQAFRVSIYGLRRHTGTGSTNAIRRRIRMTFNGDVGPNYWGTVTYNRIVKGQAADESVDTFFDATEITWQGYADAALAGAQASHVITVHNRPGLQASVDIRGTAIGGDELATIRGTGAWNTVETIHTIRLVADAPSFGEGALFVLEAIV